MHPPTPPSRCKGTHPPENAGASTRNVTGLMEHARSKMQDARCTISEDGETGGVEGWILHLVSGWLGGRVHLVSR
jgi:hypothetical protein